jgi:hypothetical protein
MTRCCPLLAYKWVPVPAETVPSNDAAPPVDLETVSAANAPCPVGQDLPLQNRERKKSVREVVAFAKQLSRKDKKEKIQKAPRLFLQKSCEALRDGHTILSLFFHERWDFPRSDRVLIFLAYLMSQFFVIGLFRNSGVIQDQWVCTPAVSDALLWRAMDYLNGTDGLVNGAAASSIIWVNGTASSISAKGWCDSMCGSNSTIQQNVKRGSNPKTNGRKGTGGVGGSRRPVNFDEHLSPLERQCNGFCDCVSQPPELVYLVSYALLVILLSSLPVTIMAASLPKGREG